MVEFYLTRSLVQPNIGRGLLWRLILASAYAGEAGFVNAWLDISSVVIGAGFILVSD